MVWFPPDNGQCPVELLQEQDTSHLVGKGHGGKRQLEICLFQDIRSQTIWPSSQKTYSSPATFKLPREETGKFQGGKCSAMFGQNNPKKIIPGQGFNQLWSLATTKLPGIFFAPRAPFLYLPELDRNVTSQPLQIAVNFSLQPAVSGLADKEKPQLHASTPWENSRRGASLQIPSRS